MYVAWALFDFVSTLICEFRFLMRHQPFAELLRRGLTVTLHCQATEGKGGWVARLTTKVSHFGSESDTVFLSSRLPVNRGAQTCSDVWNVQLAFLRTGVIYQAYLYIRRRLPGSILHRPAKIKKLILWYMWISLVQQYIEQLFSKTSSYFLYINMLTPKNLLELSFHN